jgi:hypothetical protein
VVLRNANGNGYDRVLADPTFSQKYTRRHRVRGTVRLHARSEKGKNADLMFVQPMLAVLKADGQMATVMPHGCFSGGAKSAQAFHRTWLARGDHRIAGRRSSTVSKLGFDHRAGPWCTPPADSDLRGSRSGSGIRPVPRRDTCLAPLSGRDLRDIVVARVPSGPSPC